MLTVGVSIPLQRGRLNAGVREAEAMADMARADLAAMTRMAEGEAATARSQLLAARQRVLALRDDVLPRARHLRLGSEFMPPLDEGSLLVIPTTFPGISIEEARHALTAQHRIIKSFPEVESVHGKAGRAETATDPAQLDMIESVVALKFSGPVAEALRAPLA